ncbi:MAG: BON domain-containing protein [Planctomycetota bacterium]|jgi:hypothetical protein|nr:MAG: BON domain-containing protein [Planctomycetota bacterium]
MSISKSTMLRAIVASCLLTASAGAADLAADVAAKLRDSGALAGYRVSVKSKSGTVWLEGQVSDEKQLAAAVGIAEATPGVERVVNRLVIDGGAAQETDDSSGRFGLPESMWGLAGVPQPSAAEQPTIKPAEKPQPKNPLALLTGGVPFWGGNKAEPAAASVQLAQAVTPVSQPQQRSPRGTSAQQRSPQTLAAPAARQMVPRNGRPQGTRTAMRTSGMAEPLALPGPAGQLADGQMVPGTMQFSDGGAMAQGQMMPGPGMAGPMPMAGTGVGMPPVPTRGEGPNMPNYAWPSYAAYPNYAGLQYPTQYSPTAWPYIGPFYPYPQVPLGWRRVSMEWDDGWWWIDFDERHHHSHHR